MIGRRISRFATRFRREVADTEIVVAEPIDRQELIDRIRAEKLTYLPELKLASLVETSHHIDALGLEGKYIEAGCALGGSAILLGSVKRTDRAFEVYDVFGMIPAPSERDTEDVHERYKVISEGSSRGIGGDRYYGYEPNLYELVHANFERFDLDPKQHAISLIKGLLDDTLVVDEPVALAHIDVDWYDPVKLCLDRIFPHLVVGGSIILDDYHDWGGCKKAADEFISTVQGDVELDDSSRAMKITRR